ncbi:TPA: hypothetical protein ACFNMI_001105 [Neisseria bacilliformis]|uniref:hypothetical protein n=1 Tax=Neisseria bacilliformis TaxID=267212 RepID=UPI0028E451BD|nr:hypothetical protein [Neisseria bacilliformis]
MKNTFSWREFFIRRLNALAVLSLAAAIAGQLGAAHWFAELFAHFMPYYAAVFYSPPCFAVAGGVGCGRPASLFAHFG